MKKTFRLMAIASMALSLVGCGDLLEGLIEDTEALAQEIEDISNGKLFQAEQATVEFENMGKIAFRNYGRDFYLEDVTLNNSDAEYYGAGKIVVTDGVAYMIDDENKVYTKIDYKNNEELGEVSESLAYSYARIFVYMNETYKNAVKLGKIEASTTAVNLKSGTMTVAGKTCDYISYEEGKAFVKMAGYKRVIMYIEDTSSSEGSTVIKAKSFVETADANLFKVPEGYREITEE